MATDDAATRRPFPLLAISGEQGSANGVLSKFLKGLIDANVAPERSLAHEECDLMIAANHSHVLAFDNLSDVPPSPFDAFCRLATGGSFAVRQPRTCCAPPPIAQNGDCISLKGTKLAKKSKTARGATAPCADLFERPRH